MGWIKINKRAQSQYITWMIIISIVIGMSYIFYTWAVKQATTSGEAIEKQADPVVCGNVGITMAGMCQDSNELRMNISNTNNLMLTGINIKTLGLYPEDEAYTSTIFTSTNIKSGETDKIIILKQGTLNQIKITPVTYRNGKNIYCEEKTIMFEKEDLNHC